MTEPIETYELLYFDQDRSERDRVRDLLSAHYGSRVRFEDASDWIHGYRLALWIADETEDGWCEFARQHDLTRIGLVALTRAAFGEDTDARP